MEAFTINQLNELAGKKEPRSVTIFSPTRRQSTDNYQQDKIHFKNQLQDAEAQLAQQYGMSEAEAKEYLHPGYDLLADNTFWQYGQDMLAFFLSPGESQYFQLPLPIESPELYIGHSYRLRPMLPLLHGNEQYYILNLNLEDVRLYKANQYNCSEVELPENVPTSIDDYLQYVEKQESLQHQSGVGAAGGIFHGHGVTDRDKTDIEQYFYMLSQELDKIFKEDQIPVVLAGVEYLPPRYRKTTHYNKISEESITGSFGPKDGQKLHQEAKELMMPHFQEKQTQAEQKYHNLKSGDMAASDTEKTVLAALTGQVETLFLRRDAVLWGQYDAENYQLHTEQDSAPGNTDLLTEAAVQTVLMKGEVYLCNADEMPAGDSVVVAVFRNPVVL
ncbi:hypothetical protein GCM10027275_48920 [Rhabdobacter roseus]|uniref:Uncharacterized protein n=1 Tax=Rhabdobacter roseus TaxID=1655419 RepID=A0A840TRJ4_9BACT|nr:hypothetical protein [Rhabdobacter roseus]MBB5286956.1 hypothetical protein [Rhabdobacter roseus]